MEEKPKKNEFWKTPRGKALIKLGLWMIFLIFLLVITSFNGPTIPQENNDYEGENMGVTFGLYNDMISELEKNNYAFKYEIKIGEEKYLFEGSNDGENISGYKENKENIIHYYINSEGMFEQALDELKPLENLYENIDLNIINVGLLFDSVNNINYKVEKDDTIRTITYDTVDYSLVVTTDFNHITNIKVTKGLDEYNLSYSSIGEIKNLSYTK